MSLSNRNPCQDAFANVARASLPKPLPPLSIRLTWEERERLKCDAGSLSVSAYIRLKLFDDTDGLKSLKRKSRPQTDYVMLGQILGLLGKSELASSLCVLAAAAQSGAWPVSEEIEEELMTACTHVDEMRLILIKALGIKVQ